jgi:uncharacterized membrane protein
VNSTNDGRNESIDTYRGLACVLLVAYHTIGGSVTGLRLDEDSFWRTFGDGLIYFRMPMFAFLRRRLRLEAIYRRPDALSSG